jgi:hypothetical protein
MVVNVETEDDELMLAVQIELDRTVTKEVCDAVYEIASRPPEEKTSQKLDYDCKSRRNVIMSVIANSVSLERLYFIIRSSIMGLIAGAFTFSIISVLKVTNFWQLAFLGLVGFVTSLLASRVLDKSIVQVCNKTIFYLKRHKRAQDFILKRF